MKKCNWCGTKFDVYEAESEFLSDCRELAYEKIRVPLCGSCACKMNNNKVTGVYYEYCEKCGCTFDLYVDESTFDSQFPWYNGTTLRDAWDKENRIMCASCGIEAMRR